MDIQRKDTSSAVKSGANMVLWEGLLSVIGNVLLFVVKLYAGIVTGSIALTADAWHTLTDSISSAIVIFSGWLSSKPADESHPFGHGRTDLICSVIIGVLLAFVGFEFLLKSFDQFRNGVSVEFGKIAFGATLLSILVKELMAQFAFWAGRKTGNVILKADGWHHRTDALSSVIILAGMLVGGYFWWIDGVLGVIVALMIFYASYEILRDSINRLIGERPGVVMLEQVYEIIRESEAEVDPHHFHVHRYGSHVELTFHLSMDPHLSLEKAHDITEKIEDSIRDRLDIEATIHMEPFEKEAFYDRSTK